MKVLIEHIMKECREKGIKVDWDMISIIVDYFNKKDDKQSNCMV